MNRVRYVGFDVHQASTSVAVHNAQGKCLVESILETSSEVMGVFLVAWEGLYTSRLRKASTRPGSTI